MTPDHLDAIARRAEINRIVDAGERMFGQVLAYSIQVHDKDGHPGVWDQCQVGACRATRLNLNRWELATGDHHHNWIAEQGRKS